MNLSIEQENIIKENWGKIPLSKIHKEYFSHIKYVTLSSHVRYKMGLNHGKNPWNNYEIDLVKKWYEIPEGLNLLKLFLPYRTSGAICAQALDLGLKRKTEWTNEDIDFLVKNYSVTENKKLIKILNKKEERIKIKAAELGLTKNMSEILRKYYHNDEYFKELNLFNCFTAGRIATDGCVQDKNHGSIALTYKVARIDEVIIDDIIRDLQFTGIKEYGWKWNKSKTKKTKLVGINLNCFDKCANDLEKYFNITPRKSLTLQGPNINNDVLALSFFIGAVDGDGTITISKRKSKRKSGGYNIYPYISICGASLPFIEWCRDLIDRNFGYKFRKNSSNIQKDRKQNEETGEWSICYKYTIEGKRGAIIIDYLRQFPVSKLDRKWNDSETLTYINGLKEKFPEQFTILPKGYFDNYFAITENIS